jgi:hypothetical protein
MNHHVERHSEHQQTGGDCAAGEELRNHIRELRQQINDASEQAARTLGKR